MHIRSILFVSNVGNKSIWYVFWIDPTSIQYVEKAAENLTKMPTVLIVTFKSHMKVEELRRALYDNS